MTLSHEETVALCALARGGDNTAADRLVRAHMGIVWTVLDRLGRRGDDELIQAGRLGLWYASTKYDPARARWSTFAHRVVRQYIGRAMRARKAAAQADALPPSRLLPDREPGKAPEAMPAELLAALSDEQRRLLVSLYAGEKRRTLAEAAADLGVARHRAARLHKEALAMLRAVGYDQSNEPAGET